MHFVTFWYIYRFTIAFFVNYLFKKKKKRPNERNAMHLCLGIHHALISTRFLCTYMTILLL